MSPQAYLPLYGKQANPCFTIHAAPLLVVQSLCPPQLFSAIFALMKDDVVKKKRKKAIMYSLSLFSWTADNLCKWVSFLRFSLPKMADTSSGNPYLSEDLFTKVICLVCWVDFDKPTLVSCYADSLLLFWDLIFQKLAFWGANGKCVAFWFLMHELAFCSDIQSLFHACILWG